MLKIGISIVSFQRTEALALTLHSINSLHPPPFKVCILDNASASQNNLKTLQGKYPKFHWIFSESNHGFVGGHHLAMDWLLKQNCEVVLILNPDLDLPSNALTVLMEASEELDHKHILGPLLLIDQTSASIIDSAGLCLDSCFRAVDQCQGQFLEDTKFNGLTKSQIVWGLCGAALWIPKKLLPLGIERLLFHPGYFAYFEDVELAIFCKRQGIRLSLLPHLHFTHRRGGFGKLQNITLKDWNENPAAVRGALLNRYRCWIEYFSLKQIVSFPLFIPYEIIRWTYLWFWKPFLRPIWGELLEIKAYYRKKLHTLHH